MSIQDKNKAPVVKLKTGRLVRGVAKAMTMVLSSSMLVSVASAQSAEQELAKQLSNPVADLISVPFQLNYDDNIGSDEGGSRTVLNIQPVIPFSLNDRWTVISRTIVPVVSTNGIPTGSGSEIGLGDTIQTFFFSPNKATANGWIWGAGPAFILPTSTDDRFGLGEWGLGPSAVALRQQGPWTYGGLVNHLWDISGDTDISSTFLQPFLAYTTPDAWTFTLQTESTYDWESEQWSVPISGVVSKVITIGDQPISIAGGIRYWADGPDGGPQEWGGRLVVTYLFPK